MIINIIVDLLSSYLCLEIRIFGKFFYIIFLFNKKYLRKKYFIKNKSKK